jgi:SAM-dependent methyltransferase
MMTTSQKAYANDLHSVSCTVVSNCRACGADDLTPVLPLGEMPLANALIEPDALLQHEHYYPLTLAFCSSCALVQILETLPPERLFSEYVYFSSFSDALTRHARDHAERLIAQRQLTSQNLVVEIASNDGYMLRNFVSAGIPVLGIDPARNIARVAEERGIPTRCEFFGARVADGIVADGMRADVILANNVIAHIPDINGVMAGIRTLLKPGGVFVMETPYVKDLIDQLEFDTIYHEHLFYYSLTALETLFRANGLAAADVEHVAIHGGSLRVTAVRAGEEGERLRVRDLLAEEERWGVRSAAPYLEFARRVAALRGELINLIEELKDNGYRIAAYGAAAKGATLLNYTRIDRRHLDFVVDRSTYKQGRYMPGVRLPILPPEQLLEEMPDYVLLLSWNFADEVLRQQQDYRARAGRFIIPVPTPRVL